MRTLRWVLVVLVAVLASFAGTAQARDERLMLPIADAMAAARHSGKLDPGIRLYFGPERPAVARSLGQWRTNKRTNAFGKSEKQACEWAFLSAMIKLQERARREGGNAVVGIQSNYRNIVTNSGSKYMCGAGSMVVGVAFRGEVARVAR